ncbi:MAG: 4-hydroxy-tetrahydrodipicolinate reductase [Clostridia bacterium]|nr:4-hydroxy-tetrahydrodipicolinate reductase [Clostridia bacterium]
MNILLSGIGGHMGREVAKLAKEGYRGASLACGVDPYSSEECGVTVYKSFADVLDEKIDCIVDFSHHSVTEELISFAKARELPLIVATTGHTESEISLIKNAAEYIPVFYSGNMSLGIALLMELAKTVAAAMPEAEIEIIERHHNRKLDAPSGTALMLADAIIDVRPEAYTNLGRSGQGKRTKDEIGIHSVRMGNIVGEHEVIIGTPNQTITLKHEAHDRALFAEGALAAAEFIIGCPKGLYDMKSIVGEKSYDDIIVAN